MTTVFGAAYATQPAFGNNFPKNVYLWISVVGNIIAVLIIPIVGNLSDRIGRRIPIIVGALGSGALSFLYLYSISIQSVPIAIAVSFLMWGVVYQGYNAVFPSFYPELFQTKVRVSAMAISQKIGTAITAFLPTVFTLIVKPGTSDIPLIIGGITFGITAVAAIAAFTARETFRLPIDLLGHDGSVPMAKPGYDRLRDSALAISRATG